MRRLFKSLSLYRRMQVGLFVLAIVAWPVLVFFDAYALIHDLGREGAMWNADHLFVLVALLMLASLGSLALESLHLRRIIADRELQRMRADKNARHDPLTGLPNRRAFMQALDSVRDDPGGGVRVLSILDLDRFKPVNDLHGHPAGDALLCALSVRLQETFGARADIARLGGDEFGILFHADVDVGRAEQLMRVWLSAVAEPVAYGQTLLQVGSSAGMALFDGQEATSDAMHNADQALYSAKNARKGQFAWYDAQFDAEAIERSRLETDLRVAVRERHIEAYFQPLFEIETAEICGFEVLARWNHPDLGWVSPDRFIPIAEESTLIADLGWSVLTNACKAARDWDQRLKLAVNISPQQFGDRSLARKVARILEQTDFPPSRLELEITERAIIRDFEAARETIQTLRSMGVSTALDDFGNGHSSLASLRDLPLDRIKIDRSFVTDIQSHPENRQIVSGIMALARGLGLEVTAEGIESESDRQFLETLGCTRGQGFWMSEAVSADDVPWLKVTQWAERADELREEFEGMWVG